MRKIISECFQENFAGDSIVILLQTARITPRSASDFT